MRRWTRRLRAGLLLAAVAVAGIAVNMVLLGIAAESSGDPVGRFKARLSETVSDTVSAGLSEPSAPKRKARATKPRRSRKPAVVTTTSSGPAPALPPNYDDQGDGAEPGEDEDD
jgi:hypothetical protein